jgi:Na+/H+ antiporter NhaC
MQELLWPISIFALALVLLLIYLGASAGKQSKEIRAEIPPEVQERASKKKAAATAERWIKALIAVLAGNALYYAALPHLPPAARHEPFQFDLGVIVDLWFCLFAYGLVELGLFLWRRSKR